MKNAPPVLHGNEWDWPSDGSEGAWPDYLKAIPVRRLLRQVEVMDTPLIGNRGSRFGRKAVD
jgi:hypothetical protein